METPTLEAVLTRHEQTVLDHLDQQVTVPVVDFGRQGDVIVIPARLVLNEVEFRAVNLVPADGVPVVRGENGGNTHLLVAEGDVRFDSADATTGLALGVLTVAPDAIAYLIHPEHGAIGFGPGTYQVRRQREQAAEVRLVRD